MLQHHCQKFKQVETYSNGEINWPWSSAHVTSRYMMNNISVADFQPRRASKDLYIQMYICL